jgi:hypothetical protein
MLLYLWASVIDLFNRLKPGLTDAEISGEEERTTLKSKAKKMMQQQLMQQQQCNRVRDRMKIRLRTLLHSHRSKADAVGSYANGMKGVTCNTSAS